MNTSCDNCIGWMTLAEQLPEEGEIIIGYYQQANEFVILCRVCSGEHNEYEDNKGEGMGDPDRWTVIPEMDCLSD